jgi:acyl dehydratase
MAHVDPVFHVDTGEVEWIEPEAGFEFTPLTLSVPGEFQVEKLRAAGIDPAVFGDTVDPSFFIGVGIRAGIRNGISAEGGVNMVQRLVQNRPVRLGEVLTVRGRIESVREVPRGHTVETTVTFEDASGAAVIDASRLSLRPDPDQGARRGAGERPPPVVPDPALVRILGEHQLTPERVKRYSMEGNSIHYDEDAARRAGFRAPMIGGGMGVHFLAAMLWSRGAPRTLDLSIYFRRPIFWDERFTSGVLGDAQDISSWEGLCLLRDEGDAGLKVLTEATIQTLVVEADSAAG